MDEASLVDSGQILQEYFDGSLASLHHEKRVGCPNKSPTFTECNGEKNAVVTPFGFR